MRPMTTPARISETRGAFTASEYARRLEATRASMETLDVDALIVTSPENIYYLVGLNHQGYFSFSALVLPREGTGVLVTRAMERVTIARQAPDVLHVGYEDGESAGRAAVTAVVEAGCADGRIGVDRTSIFFPPAVSEELKEGLAGAEWVDTTRSPSTDPALQRGILDDLRLVKSEEELEHIRRCAAITDRAARAGMTVAGVGVNEKEIAAAVYGSMILGGSEFPGFAPFIRSADSLREEHTTWRDRPLAKGEPVFLELSASVFRYHAPIGRTSYMAAAPPGVERAYAIAIDAMEAVRGALVPGRTTGEVYQTWQEVIDEGLGHSRLRRHHCGYNVGIGFPPSWVGSSAVLGIRPYGKVEIRRGMTFHVLSWVTDDELGDYYASDTVVVEETGGSYLTSTSHKLVIT